MIYYITDNRSQAIHLREIPEVDYAALYEDLKERLTQEQYHVAHYFARPEEQKLRFYLILLDDATAQIMISSFSMEYYEDIALPSLTALHPALHPFEREITELYNVEFDSMPWNKPLRFAFNRRNRNSTIDNYPFYTIEGESLHEVNVGPIHAGIIEPGAFRFICNGENVLHLEIALGYQHRGVENEFTATDNRLRQMLLSESIAGDSAVSHGVSDHIPTMTNYTFGGWYSHEIATTEVPNTEEGHTKYYSCNYFTDNSVSLAEDLTLTGPTTLHARWLPFTINTYASGHVWEGYKYITFANHATQESAYYSSSAGDIAAHWIVIGAGESVNSAVFNGVTRPNGVDTTTEASELDNNEILLLSEQTLISDAFDDDNGDGKNDSGYDIGNWSDDGCTLRNWLNDETTNTTHVAYNNIKGFLTTTGLLMYKSYIQEKTIYTAWQGNATASDATSATSTDRVFLLATNTGYNNQVGSGTNYENAYGSQSFIMEKYLGSYTHDDASSNPKIFSFSGKNTSYWWLRSSYCDNNISAYLVNYSGRVGSGMVFNSYAVRPSFILNLA